MKQQEQEAIAKCICPGCPTYADCSKQGGKREKAFCLQSIGKSQCIAKEKGCICPGCPVLRKFNFKQCFCAIALNICSYVKINNNNNNNKTAASASM